MNHFKCVILSLGPPANSQNFLGNKLSHLCRTSNISTDFEYVLRKYVGTGVLVEEIPSEKYS